MDPLTDSITVPELEMLLQDILNKATIKETFNYYGHSDGFTICDINSSSTGKEKYKKFIETIVCAMEMLSD